MSTTVTWGEPRVDDTWMTFLDVEGPNVVPETQPDRITRDDDVWGGMATVAGSRVPVFMIADLEDDGESVNDIQRRYPHLTRADIYAALSYAHAFRGVVDTERASYLRAIERYRR